MYYDIRAVFWRFALIKLVVSDVDGTLIYKNEKLNKKRFPVMLRLLAGFDVPFVVATGRHYREIKKMFEDQSCNFISVCCDGSYAIAREKIIYSLPVPKIAVKHMFEACQNLPVSVVFHAVDVSYIFGSTNSHYSKEQSRLSNVIKINSADQIKEEIYFITVYGKNHNLVHDSLRVSYSSDTITEYVNRNASKYNAVRYISKALKIDDSEILSFGDGENDNELLQKSGIAYTTYCAAKKTFCITDNHTRDVIGTVISLFDKHKKFTFKEV